MVVFSNWPKQYITLDIGTIHDRYLAEYDFLKKKINHLDTLYSH